MTRYDGNGRPRPTCTERYFPTGDSYRTVLCGRPAKGEALFLPYSKATWEPKCGIHLRRYQQTRREVSA